MMKTRTDEGGDYSRAAGGAGEPPALDDDADVTVAGDETTVEDLPPLALVLPAAIAGRRLDAALAAVLGQYSRSRLQEWIRGGRVCIDGEPCIEVRYAVRGGEAVVIAPQTDRAATSFVAEAIALPVIFEDESLIVIDKPAGLVVHPGSGNWRGTLLNGLLHRDPRLATVPRAGIVHRLDKDTSGLLVVARTVTAQTDLVRQLQARSVKRDYLAIVHGALEVPGTVDAPIGRHPTQRVRMAVVDGGRPAITRYRPVERLGGATLVECSLQTGRTHQIRVHMAHIGHPLVGDPLYGRRRDEFPRQALHAARLALRHPQHGVTMQWESPPPADFLTLRERLRAAR
jgi:23S rRNA pseudouridine1911/1915/1917 synthase